MRILIIGGTGFIGVAVVRKLNGHDITVFHRGRSQIELAGVRIVRGDRDELDRFHRFFRELRPDVVLDMIPKNADDARQTINSVAETGARLVAVSSGSVYRSFGVLMGTEPGDADNTAANEDSPVRQRLFPYRGSTRRREDDPKRWLDDYDKIAAERAYLTHRELCTSIIRLPMVYGPGDPDRRIAPYLKRMMDGRPVILLREAAARWRNARAYVDNVAEAIARVVLKGAPGRLYNVAEPEDLTEAEWVHMIGQLSGWRGLIRLVSDDCKLGRPAIDEFSENANFAQHLRMDTSRIRRELGYVEPISRQDGLKRTIDAALKDLPSIDYSEEDELLLSRL